MQDRRIIEPWSGDSEPPTTPVNPRQPESTPPLAYFEYAAEPVSVEWLSRNDAFLSSTRDLL